jgi:hypothetical protein
MEYMFVMLRINDSNKTVVVQVLIFYKSVFLMTGGVTKTIRTVPIYLFEDFLIQVVYLKLAQAVERMQRMQRVQRMQRIQRMHVDFGLDCELDCELDCVYS